MAAGREEELGRCCGGDPTERLGGGVGWLTVDNGGGSHRRWWWFEQTGNKKGSKIGF